MFKQMRPVGIQSFNLLHQTKCLLCVPPSLPKKYREKHSNFCIISCFVRNLSLNFSKSPEINHKAAGGGEAVLNSRSNNTAAVVAADAAAASLKAKAAGAVTPEATTALTTEATVTAVTA